MGCERVLNAPWESRIIVNVPVAHQTGLKFASILDCKVLGMSCEFSCSIRPGM